MISLKISLTHVALSKHWERRFARYNISHIKTKIDQKDISSTLDSLIRSVIKTFKKKVKWILVLRCG